MGLDKLPMLTSLTTRFRKSKQCQCKPTYHQAQLINGKTTHLILFSLALTKKKIILSLETNLAKINRCLENLLAEEQVRKFVTMSAKVNNLHAIGAYSRLINQSQIF